MRMNVNRSEATRTDDRLAAKQELLLLRRRLEYGELPEGERQLLLRKLNREISRMELEGREVVLSSWPRRVILSPAGNCNLRCTMCSLSHGQEPWPDWSLEDLRRFEPMLRHAESVVPIGIGEPLSVTGYLELVAWLKSFGLYVEFSTNGTLLGEEAAHRILALGVDAISISLDAATEETYRTIRRNRFYPRLIENIERLVRLRREAGSKKPSITLSAVVQRANLAEMPAFARRAAALGADRVLLELLNDFVPALTSASTRDTPEETDRILDEAEEEGRRCGLSVHRPARLLPRPGGPAPAPEAVPSAGAGPAAGGRRLHCSMPWTSLVAWNEFSVAPCCYFGGGFGNARETPPEELWNGDAMVTLRQQLVSGELPEKCRTCAFSGIG